MLVCAISQQTRRAAIAASVAETTSALDNPGTGNIVFATLVDDPASVRDNIDAYLGQIMRETANAAASVIAGLTYASTMVESAAATDLASAYAPVVGTIIEAAAANTIQDATIVAAAVPKTIDGTAGGQFASTNTGTVTLSTTLANDVIVLMYFHQQTSAQTIATVTSPHLTWTKRKNYPSTVGSRSTDLEIWWAPSSAVLTSEVITITTTAGIDGAAYHAFGVHGCANIASPWDGNSSLATAQNTGNAVSSLTISGISTNSGAPLIIGCTGAVNPYIIPQPAGTTPIRADEHNGAGGLWAYFTSFYQSNSTALVGASYTATYSGTAAWTMMIDALA